jgi:hypothetical protein
VGLMVDCADLSAYGFWRGLDVGVGCALLWR